MPAKAEDQLRALLSLWLDLPRLCGPAWPEVQRQLDAISSRLLADKGATSPAWLDGELRRVFAGLDQVLARLDSIPTPPALTPTSNQGIGIRTRGGTVTRGGAPPESIRTRSGTRSYSTAPPAIDSSLGLARQLSQRLRPSLVTRHVDVSCPERVSLATQRISVVVRLRTAAPPAGVPTTELTLDESEAVTVRLDAPGFDLLSQPVQEMEIRPDTDSPPVVFDLRPGQVGHHLLTFNFFQHGNLLGTVTAGVECVEYEAASHETPSRTASFRTEQGATPPDMILLVSSQGAPPTLSFTLIQEGGTWWRGTFPPIPLKGDPASYAASLFRDLTGLTRRSDPVEKTHDPARAREGRLNAAEVDRSVRKLGQNLWKNLIPPDLQDLYANKRDAWRNRSLLLLSDEPNLPWELVWPYSSDGWQDDCPWCCTFRLTRWLRRDDRARGNPSPPTRLAFRSLAVVAPGDANLPSAEEERDQLLSLAADYGVADRGPALPTLTEVLALLEEGNYDWLHAAAHGNFHAVFPDGRSALWLQDRKALTPDSIVGPDIERHIGVNRPGFIFNACEVGQQGWGLTGVAGWASTLVNSGAGLFAGSLWEITDQGALTFVTDLYRRLLEGETVGEAMRLARLAARQAGDPTWLAYSLYAHPNARLLLPAAATSA